jgi:hypothetical protein
MRMLTICFLLPFPNSPAPCSLLPLPRSATNLALKGVAAIAAYGYIEDMYTGNSSAVTQYYVLAAEYAATMVQFSWNKDHFMIGYTGSQGDGGDGR